MLFELVIQERKSLLTVYIIRRIVTQFFFLARYNTGSTISPNLLAIFI
jgi:hypothetical protein